MTDRPEIKQLHKSDFQLWNVNYKNHILRLIYDHLQKKRFIFFYFFTDE